MVDSGQVCWMVQAVDTSYSQDFSDFSDSSDFSDFHGFHIFQIY